MKKRIINKRGITLASLTIYVVVATIVVGVLSFLNAQFFKNINELNQESQIVSEDLNFKAFLISDIKRSKSAEVSEFNSRLFRLSNDVKYEIRALEESNGQKRYAVYRNDVQVAKGIVPFEPGELLNASTEPSFDYDMLTNSLKVNLKFTDGKNTYIDRTSYSVGQKKHTKRIDAYGDEEEAPRHYVTYNSNNDANVEFVDVYREGGAIYIAGNNFTITDTDYELVGWSTTPTGPIEYETGAVYSDGDITLYAVWNRIHYRYDDLMHFDGTNYLNTDIKLFSERNAKRNFIASFTINEIGTGNANQDTLFACNNEVRDPYQGTGFRYVTGDQYQFFANAFVRSEKRVNFPIDNRNKVTILRIDEQLYYKFCQDGNDNNVPFYPLLDYQGFTNYIEIPATFGGSINERGNYYRFFKGALSNMYIRIDENIKASDYTFYDESGHTKEMFEFFRKDGITTFLGVSGDQVINTHYKLFATENRQQEFDLTFTIRNHQTNSTTQQTLVNGKAEDLNNWPGFAVRYNGTSNNLEVTNRGGSPAQRTYTYNNLSYPAKVRIYRVGYSVYVSINNENPRQIADYTSLTPADLDTELIIGGTFKDGIYQRLFKGEVEDIVLMVENDIDEP